MLIAGLVGDTLDCRFASQFCPKLMPKELRTFVCPFLDTIVEISTSIVSEGVWESAERKLFIRISAHLYFKLAFKPAGFQTATLQNRS